MKERAAESALPLCLVHEAEQEYDEMPRVLDFTQPHALRTEAEYDAAAREIDALLDEDPAPGSAAHDRLEFLGSENSAIYSASRRTS